MSFDNHANLAISTVATQPSPATSGTSLVVASGDGAIFPAAPFNATIWPADETPTLTNAEIIRVTGKLTDTLTIVRAQEGTSARVVGAGDQISATLTAKMLTDIESASWPESQLTTSDVTTANVTTAKHGFTPKAPNDTTKFLRGDATWAVPPGGSVTEGDITLSDVTTDNVSITQHGFTPKAPNDTAKFLRGDATWAVPPGGSVTESDLSLSDVTTDNVTIAKHGFAPKAPNDATKYLDGTGAYSIPAGGGGGGGVLAVAQYAPASLATYNVTASSLTALDTTNLTVTFTVPGSGAVTVMFAAVMAGATAHVLALGLLNHSGGAQLGNTYNSVLGGDNGSGSPVSATYVTATWYLSGLSAGALGIDIAGSVVSSTAHVFAQGATGGANDSKAAPALIVVTQA